MEENRCAKIKICGITSEREVLFLNQSTVSYVGFVFVENSKRYITEKQIKTLSLKLNENIIKVAVVIKPDAEKIKQVCKMRVDRIQIHGKFDRSILEYCTIPVWIALNIQDLTEQDNKESFHDILNNSIKMENDSEVKTRYNNIKNDNVKKTRIEAIVLDGANAGAGSRFDWESYQEEVKRWRSLYPELKLILAGGLNARNVQMGIQIFSPDIVDVSSGVEIETQDGSYQGKDESKIKDFIESVEGRRA